MKFKKTMLILVITIVVLAGLSSYTSVFSDKGDGQYEFESVFGEKVEIYGGGNYKRDSISYALQGIAQDALIGFIFIPMLIVSFYFARKNSLRGKLMLTGTLSYFAYTFLTYTYLWVFNSLFLVYVICMSASFFALFLSVLSFDLEELKLSFNEKLPIKFIAGFQIVFGIAIALLWLEKVLPALINNTVPVGIDHYSTLVIQATDLAFILPLSFISAVLLIKRNAVGYMLSSIIIIKGFVLGSAVTSMVILLMSSGIEINIAEIIMFPAITLLSTYLMYILLKNVKQPVNHKGINL